MKWFSPSGSANQPRSLARTTSRMRFNNSILTFPEFFVFSWKYFNISMLPFLENLTFSCTIQQFNLALSWKYFNNSITCLLCVELKILSFLWQVYILCGVDKSDVWPWWTSLWRGGNHWTRDYDVGDDDYDDDDDDDDDDDPSVLLQLPTKFMGMSSTRTELQKALAPYDR